MPHPFLTSTLLALTLTGDAAAHPHVFVDATVGFDINDGILSSLHISWTYDAFTTLILYDVLELDQDGDGILDDGDLAKVAQGETDWPPEYEGDTYLETQGAPVPLAKPVNASATMTGDRISVQFELPLRSPLKLSADGAILRLYDPTYYYTYSVVRHIHSAADTDPCQVEIQPFQPSFSTATLQGKLAALSREDIPDQPDVGRLFADEIILTCQ